MSRRLALVSGSVFALFWEKSAFSTPHAGAMIAEWPMRAAAVTLPVVFTLA